MYRLKWHSLRVMATQIILFHCAPKEKFRTGLNRYLGSLREKRLLLLDRQVD